MLCASKNAPARLQGFRPAQGVRIGFGEVEFGSDGFRTTHAQAIDAHAIAGRTGRAVARYEQIALEALFTTCQEPRAQAFARRELTGIDLASRADRVLLETVAAYFASGQNATVAAARLHVHDQTVTNRIRAFEKRVGRTVPERQAELQVAMRLALLEVETADARPRRGHLFDSPPRS
jgi:DNA-binding PucR family transcriptional regulator